MSARPAPSRRAALGAGLGLLLMAAAAPVAVFVLLPKGQLGVAAGLLFAVAVLDVLVAVALHVALRDGDGVLSAIAAALRIAYAVMFVLALRHLVAGAGSVDAYERAWNVALGVFGLHLVVLGVVLVRRAVWGRVLGVLVVVAGLGYCADGAATLATGHPLGVAGVTFVGELALMAWLLWSGARRAR